ncbi:hypothetical protein CSE16_11625 [Solibacillus sp. R5-41]|uniref:hypothetical protein n=1 Tax=Solibacillus sp. R5-41 TaxID=2048654 RepID=UPI000C128C4D|nr:hypothetical protein [Solibacillus sp. R5-41]ATP40645.1 hypothetical protein CSE16_11625 [Solibacillus sp. R5-41]
MKEFEKIHILSQELIPVFDELEDASKNIILEHIEICKNCHSLYVNQLNDEDYSIPVQDKEQIEMKPLKKLVQFNRSLKGMLFVIRGALLFFILGISFIFYNWELSSDAAVEFIKNTLFLFYFPSTIFLNLFTLVFFNQKWVWLAILFDLIIILFLDTFISILI